MVKKWYAYNGGPNKGAANIEKDGKCHDLAAIMDPATIATKIFFHDYSPKGWYITKHKKYSCAHMLICNNKALKLTKISYLTLFRYGGVGSNPISYKSVDLVDPLF